MMNLYVSMLALSIALGCFSSSDHGRAAGGLILIATIVVNILDCLGMV